MSVRGFGTGVGVVVVLSFLVGGATVVAIAPGDWQTHAYLPKGSSNVGGLTGTGAFAQSTLMVGHPRPSASTDPISVAGYDSSEVALSWQQSGDFCFTDYKIQEATYSNGGPWNTIQTFTSSGITSMISGGFQPGQTAWFQDIDDSGCSGGSATSNVVSVTFPSYASLSYSDSGSSTVQASWTNSASYGGLLSFQSYQVQESINGAGYATVGTVTTESTMTYSVTGVTGLNTGTKYQFEVLTTDICNNCQGGTYPSTAQSNVVTHLAIYQPTAGPTAVEVGQSTELGVSVIGGTSPYSYAWTGLPAGCSSSDAQPISCSPSSAGSYSVTVTVTDARGSTLTSLPVSVSVTANTSGGGGGGGGGGGSGGGGPTTSSSAVGGNTILIIVAVVVVVAIAAVGLIMYGRRKGPSPPQSSAAPTQWAPPPQGPAPPR